MRLNKLTSAITAIALSATTFLGAGLTAQASNVSNGSYTADVTMWQYYNPQAESMCSSLFAQKAEITVSGDYSEITLYVASPIPNFAEDSATAVADGGIMKDTTAVIDETRYASTYAVANVDKYFSKTGSLFGIEAGNSYATDIIKVVVPTSAIIDGSGDGTGNTEEMIHIESFVNVFMMRTENFFMELTGIETSESGQTDDKVEDDNVELPSQSETRSATVTATVAKNESTYTVTVPSSIELSELSTSDDTAVAYDVKVEFSKIGNDEVSIQVATESSGVIKESVSGYELTFTNDFGTQTFTETKTVTGNVAVKGTDVFNAEAGDYTGTVSFVITTNK